MKYVLLVTAGLIVLFFGAYLGLKWWHGGTAAPNAAVDGGVTETGTSSQSTQQSGWQTFTSADGSVSVDYPAEAQVKGVAAGPTQEWTSTATKANGSLLADIRIPREYMPGTNFSEGKFTIGRSADAAEIKNCTLGPEGLTQRGTATIGGYTFNKFEFADAAAGNRYDTTLYRGIFDGDCYVIEYTIHSTNIQNYPAEAGIEEFDKAEIAGVLEKMRGSVKFNISSD